MNRFHNNSTRSRGILVASLTVAICILIGGTKSASAQSDNSFQVVGDVTPFDFSVNGTSISSTTGADLTKYLNTGTDSTNTLTVGWNPPQEGSYIDMEYTGTGSFSFGNTTVTNGDFLHIYAIAGAYLFNSASISDSAGGSTLTYWNGTTATDKWSSATNANYVGYDTSWSANDPFLAYNNSSTGVDGKSFSKASKDGTFNLNGLKLGNAATYLGLDIYAEVYDSKDQQEACSASTGRIVVEGFSPNSILPQSVVPEGSSLGLIAAGLLPLAWQGRRFLKRRACVDSPTV